MSRTSTSSTRTYSIIEPHPSVVASTSYIHTGRGGAGNLLKAPSTVTRGTDASGPASRIALSSFTSPRKTFSSGRGGAGNMHPESERAIFSFDEELERQLSHERHAAPVYHVGRGGAGNITASSTSSRTYLTESQRRGSSNSRTSFASTSSTESGADVLNRNLKKGFKKMMSSGL